MPNGSKLQRDLYQVEMWNFTDNAVSYKMQWTLAAVNLSRIIISEGEFLKLAQIWHVLKRSYLNQVEARYPLFHHWVSAPNNFVLVGE